MGKRKGIAMFRLRSRYWTETITCVISRQSMTGNPMEQGESRIHRQDTEKGVVEARLMPKELCMIMGIRNFFPRSQLIFTVTEKTFQLPTSGKQVLICRLRWSLSCLSGAIPTDRLRLEADLQLHVP